MNPRQSVIKKYSYDAEVDFWSKLNEKGLFNSEQILVDKYFKKSNGKILDVGCGTGREAFELRDKGFDVVGIDIVPKMIERARSISRSKNLKIDFLVMDVVTLGFKENSFDYVFMAGSPMIQYIPRRGNRIKAIKEIKRVLKPGGILILSSWNTYHSFILRELYRALYFIFRYFLLIFSNKKHYSYYEEHNILKETKRKQLLKLLKIKISNFLLVLKNKTSREKKYDGLEPGDVYADRVSPIKTSSKIFTHLYTVKEMLEDIETGELKVIEYKTDDEIKFNINYPPIIKRFCEGPFYYVMEK